jgi:hypothetical protein
MTGTVSLPSLNVNGLPSRLRPFRVRAAELGRWFEESTVDVLNVADRVPSLQPMLPRSVGRSGRLLGEDDPCLPRVGSSSAA